MKVKFCDIANFKAGQSPESKYYSDSSGVPFLQGTRAFGTFYPTIDTYTTKVTKMAHKGDILMSVRAPVGDLNFAPCDLCIGRGLSSITAKNGNNDFLFYALKFNIKSLFNQSSGTTYDSVTGDNINRMNMIIPDDENSFQYISQLLHNIDAKIENNSAICSDLESMAKLLYDYCFVQFDFPDENGKPYKSSGGKMVWNEELKREIPEGWEVKHAADITNVRTGKEDANFATPEGPHKYFTCGQEILKCDISAFEGKAVLLAGNGDFNVKHYTGKFNAYQRTYVLIPNDEKYYAILYIATERATERLKMGAAGSIVKFITMGDVNGITFLDPHNDNMLKVFNDMLIHIEHLQNENERLANLRDFLLPMLMNGQVKVGKDGE